MSEAAVEPVEPVEFTEPVEVDWRDGSALSGDASFDKFGSLDDLGKSYREMEKFSSGALRIPTEDASDDAKAAFLDKVTTVPGVMRVNEDYVAPPAEIDGYRFSDVEGFDGDSSVDDLRAKAHELGLTNSQADGIHSWLASTVVERDQEEGRAFAESMQEVKQKWGVAFEQKANQVENTIAALSEKIPGLKDAERSAPFVQLMAIVGDLLGEAGIVSQDPRVQMTPAEASQKIMDIEGNKNHPAHPSNQGHPNYEKARDALMELYRIKNM